MVVWLSVDVNVTPTASYDAAADPMSIMVGGPCPWSVGAAVERFFCGREWGNTDPALFSG